MRTRLSSWLAAVGRKKILLLRHGHIETDNGKRFLGRIDLPLSDAGRAQAHAWRSCLAPISLGLIVASDLVRCQETARIIAAGDRKVQTAPALREIDLGRWDGMPVADVKRRWPDAYAQRGLDMAGFRPPAGESFLDLQNRVVPAFESAAAGADGPLLIVTHAGVIRVLLCHILGMPAANVFRIVIDHGSLTLVDLTADGYRVQALNLTLV